MEKRLYRARDDRIIFGLLGGIARYLDVDPAVVRIAFVLVSLVQPVFIVGYFLMALVVPEEKAGDMEASEDDGDSSSETRSEEYVRGERDARTRALFGAILIGTGIYIILEKYVHFPFGLREMTGVILLALGVYVVLKK